MRVFRIGFDVTKFQALLVDGDDDFSFPFFDLMSFRSGAFEGEWTPPPVYIDQPRLKRPDLFHLVGATGIVLTPRAEEILEDFTARSGQLLPLQVGSTAMQLFNVTEIIDCLDQERTSCDEGGYAFVLQFLVHRVPEVPLFRIPQNRSSEIFCHEGVAEVSWEFKRTVEENDLTGLTFEEVWNSDEGGIWRPPAW